MREILYRAKRVDNGELVYGDLVHSKDKCYIKPMGNAFEVNEAHLTKLVVMHPVDPETVCEYTGKKDMNGIRIFENDIVQQFYEKCTMNSDDYIGKHVGVVKISPSLGCFMRNPISEDDITGKRNRIKRCVPIRSYRSQVIGTIFDNKELLEGKR